MGVISSIGNAPGVPVIDLANCTNCGRCAAICPVEVLRTTENGIAIDNCINFGCIACGQCMMVCPSECVTVNGRNLCPTDIIDLPPFELRATAEQLSALLLARRSVRKFSDAEVPRELLDQVITMSATAPMGIPPWEVGITVLHGQEKVAELARDSAKAYGGFLKFFDNKVVKNLSRIFMKKPVWQQFQSFIVPLGRVIANGEKQGKDYVFYNAPAALMFHVSPYAAGADAFIACTYAMLAAESLGLGSCMIGCSAPMISRSKDLQHKYLIPAGHQPQIILIMGYHDHPHRKAVRRVFQSVNFF